MSDLGRGIPETYDTNIKCAVKSLLLQRPNSYYRTPGTRDRSESASNSAPSAFGWILHTELISIVLPVSLLFSCGLSLSGTVVTIRLAENAAQQSSQDSFQMAYNASEISVCHISSREGHEFGAASEQLDLNSRTVWLQHTS